MDLLVNQYNIDNYQSNETIGEKINNIEINYNEMKQSINDILNTNFGQKYQLSKFYKDLFILDERNEIDESNFKESNYFSLIKMMSEKCFNELDANDLTVSSFINKTINNSNSIFKLLNRNVNLDLVNKYISYEKTKSNSPDDFFETLENILSTRCRDSLYQDDLNNYKSLFQISFPAKFVLFIKIIVLYVNPNIDSSLISNERLPYLTLLDLIEDITDREKEIILNIVKLKIIIKMKKMNVTLFSVPYVMNNSSTVETIMEKMNDVKDIINNFFTKIEIENLTEPNLQRFISVFLGFAYLNDRLNYDKEYFISLLTGAIHFKSNKIKLENFKKFDKNILEDTFDPRHLDSLDRKLTPLLFTKLLNNSFNTRNFNKFLDGFFNSFLPEKSNIFSDIVNSELPNERKLNIKKLLRLDTENPIDFKYISLNNLKHTVNIDTESKVEVDKVFNPDDDELECPKNKELYTNVLNISKQFFEKTVITPLVHPYFRKFPIKFSGYGLEEGFDTGPTKQIINNYSKLMNYIIKYNESSNKITYTTPIWAKNNEKTFYTFLTHYLITDLKLQASNLNFYLKFNMLVPTMIDIMNKYNDIYNFNKLHIFNIFNKFMKVKNVKNLFYNDDGSQKFSNVPDNYELYYKSVSLFMIGDLIDGGKEYEYFEYNIDPDNEYLETKLQVFTPPSGFFDLESFLSFPFFSNRFELHSLTPTEIKLIIDKIFLFMYKFYVILNENRTISSELFISKIRFINESDPRYSIIEEYMKQFITDYTVGLPEEFIKSIKEQYETQDILNEKILLAWTASSNISADTTIELRVTVQPDLQFATCFNYLGYPVPRGDYVEINYEEFVNTILGSISGTGFGRRGGKKRKTIKKYKHYKSIKNKKKNKKLSIKNKKNKKKTIKKL